MNFKNIAATSLFALGALLAGAANAVPINGLANTGAGTPAGTKDLNYGLAKTGGAGQFGATNGYVGTGINGAWIANDATSSWLTPAQDANQTFDPSSNGIYVWTLVFDLTGFNAATAQFAGRWATDNSGSIQLNGTTLNNPSTGFGSWSGFTSAGGAFNAGLNYLTFTVTNLAQASGNPTGLRVEFSRSDVTVPEPASLGLLAIGLIGFGALRRRRE